MVLYPEKKSYYNTPIEGRNEQLETLSKPFRIRTCMDMYTCHVNAKFSTIHDLYSVMVIFLLLPPEICALNTTPIEEMSYSTSMTISMAK